MDVICFLRRNTFDCIDVLFLKVTGNIIIGFDREFCPLPFTIPLSLSREPVNKVSRERAAKHFGRNGHVLQIKGARLAIKGHVL